MMKTEMVELTHEQVEMVVGGKHLAERRTTSMADSGDNDPTSSEQTAPQ